MTKYRKKMIEVALPLEAINKASAREKSIRHGHPSTLHLWWARRPLAACRAVLFSSLVNDPDDDPMYGISEDVAATERAKLFDLLEDLVLWENSNNPTVINKARLEIARSIAANKVADGELEDDAQLVSTAPELPEEQAKYLPDPPQEYTPHDVRFKMPGLRPEQVNHFLAHYAPPVLDPFAGGGSIPLEAQRLGLRAYASDLNPVPVLINKALIEIPPRFAGQPPVNPEAQQGKLATRVYRGAEGLAEDVRYYGQWMRDEAEKRIGHLYPKVKVTQQMVDDGRPDLEPYVGQELTVIAWLWARTVPSPNPVTSGQHVPLARTFWLAKKKGKEAFVEPEIDKEHFTYRFRVKTGKPNDFDPGSGLISRDGGECLLTNVPMPFSHIREQARAGKLSQRLMAVVLLGNRCRLYLDPIESHSNLALNASPEWRPSGELPLKHRNFQTPGYGLGDISDLFTDRQTLALSTFGDLAIEAREEVIRDGSSEEYADAVATMLGIGVSRSADFWSSLCTWAPQPKNELVSHVFTRHALPMVWDFAEANPFSDAGGNFTQNLSFVAKVIDKSFPGVVGHAEQRTAEESVDQYKGIVVSTDPPYYDNINYADLSDFL